MLIHCCTWFTTSAHITINWERILRSRFWILLEEFVWLAFVLDYAVARVMLTIWSNLTEAKLWFYDTALWGTSEIVTRSTVIFWPSGWYDLFVMLTVLLYVLGKLDRDVRVACMVVFVILFLDRGISMSDLSARELLPFRTRRALGFTIRWRRLRNWIRINSQKLIVLHFTSSESAFNLLAVQYQFFVHSLVHVSVLAYILWVWVHSGSHLQFQLGWGRSIRWNGQLFSLLRLFVAASLACSCPSFALFFETWLSYTVFLEAVYDIDMFDSGCMALDEFTWP